MKDCDSFRGPSIFHRLHQLIVCVYVWLYINYAFDGSGRYVREATCDPNMTFAVFKFAIILQLFEIT